MAEHPDLTDPLLIECVLDAGYRRLTRGELATLDRYMADRYERRFGVPA